MFRFGNSLHITESQQQQGAKKLKSIIIGTKFFCLLDTLNWWAGRVYCLYFWFVLSTPMSGRFRGVSRTRSAALVGMVLTATECSARCVDERCSQIMRNLDSMSNA